MSDEDLRAELERLRAENQALKKTSSKGISLKVSEKGGVSVYGLGRFPITLYKEQWAKLLDLSDQIKAFIAENESSLKTKQWEARCSREGRSSAAPCGVLFLRRPVRCRRPLRHVEER